MSVFNLNNDIQAQRAKEYFNKLNESKDLIELKKISQQRTGIQNRALHLFFRMVADELNNLGMTFNYYGLKGSDMELMYTDTLVKETLWKPIQKALFGTTSTKELTKTKQIDQIFQVINKFFGDQGIEISFPSEFSHYLKMFQK